MENNSELLILIGSLGGTLIGFLSSILITHLNNKSAERKLYRQLAFTAGIEDWRTRTGLLKDASGSVYPIYHGLLYMLKVTEILTHKEITPAKVLQILEEASHINDAIKNFIAEKDPQDTVLFR